MYAVRELIYIGVRKNKAGVFEKYNTMFLKQNNFDVLFLGSSRTETHFNPLLFDSLTGCNSYNLGVTGATPRIAFGVLKAYCSKSELPRDLIFDVDFHFLKYGVDTIRHFPRYFPYLNNTELLKQFNQIDDRFTSFYYDPFHALPYSNFRMLSASLHGWLGIKGKYDSCYYKGFVKTGFGKELEIFPQKKFYAYINPIERRYLDSIILFSRRNKIRLTLVTSPMFAGGKVDLLNKNDIITQINNIAKINKVIYKDLSQTKFSNDRKCFIDLYHMTTKGADLFTRDFGAFFNTNLGKDRNLRRE